MHLQRLDFDTDNVGFSHHGLAEGAMSCNEGVDRQRRPLCMPHLRRTLHIFAGLFRTGFQLLAREQGRPRPQRHETTLAGQTFRQQLPPLVYEIVNIEARIGRNAFCYRKCTIDVGRT